MINFTYCSPTEFYFGKDTELELGAILEKYQAKKILIHYGQSSVKRSGLLDLVKEQIKAQGLSFVELGGAVPNPHASLVYEGIELCRQEDVDFILGLGGGSAIDSAKAIAVGVPYAGDFWDLYEKAIPVKKALPLGTIITIPATGTEASSSSVITNTEKKMKYGYNSELIRPAFSIMNPVYTFTLPEYQVGCGAVDMISHILERYLTNTKNVDLTDRMSEAVIISIIDNTRKVLASPKDYDARANLLWAGTIAHNNLLGLGKEQDWSSHSIEHELSAVYDVAHGAGLAVVFPAFMTYTLDQSVERYAQLANRVFQIPVNTFDLKETALAGIEAFKSFFQEIKMPITLAELGIKNPDFRAIAEKVRKRNQGKLGFFRPLDNQDIVKILQLAE